MAADAVEAEVARQLSHRPAPDLPEIDADDEGRAVLLFLELQTQWNWTGTGMVQGNGGFGMRTGLKYEVIAPTAALLDIAIDAGVMRDLKVLEADALATFSEKRA